MLFYIYIYISCRIGSSSPPHRHCSLSSIQTRLKWSTIRDTPSSASTSPRTLCSTGLGATSSVTSTRTSWSRSCPLATVPACSPGSPSSSPSKTRSNSRWRTRWDSTSGATWPGNTCGMSGQSLTPCLSTSTILTADHTRSGSRHVWHVSSRHGGFPYVLCWLILKENRNILKIISVNTLH